MIDTKRAMTGTTLTLPNTNEVTGLDQKPFDIVEQLMTKDLDYIEEEDGEETAKDESEDEDFSAMETGPLELETGPLELEEISDLHEDITTEAGELETEPVIPTLL